MFTKFRLNHWGSRDKKKIKNFLVFFFKFFGFYRPWSRFGESDGSQPRPLQMGQEVIRMCWKGYSNYLGGVLGYLDGLGRSQVTAHAALGCNFPVLNPSFLKINIFTNHEVINRFKINTSVQTITLIIPIHSVSSWNILIRDILSVV